MSDEALLDEWYESRGHAPRLTLAEERRLLPALRIREEERLTPKPMRFCSICQMNMRGEHRENGYALPN